MKGPRATQVRRQAILDAALQCFDTLGVVGTKIEDIRAASGASIGSLYHHFSSKEAIAAALYVELMRVYQQEAARKLHDDLRPRQWIRAAIDHHARWSVKNPSAARFFLTYREPEIHALAQPEAAQLNRDWENDVAQWLDRQVGAKRIRPIRPELFIAIVIGPIHRLVRRWAFGSSRTPPTKAVELLTDAAWRAVRQDQRSDALPS